MVDAEPQQPEANAIHRVCEDERLVNNTSIYIEASSSIEASAWSCRIKCTMLDEVDTMNVPSVRRTERMSGNLNFETSWLGLVMPKLAG